jgi:hypothetical protein
MLLHQFHHHQLLRHHAAAGLQLLWLWLRLWL